MPEFTITLPVLIVSQLILLPLITVLAALAARRHPARAHAIITAGLLATLIAPLVSIAAARLDLGLLPGLELLSSQPVAVGLDAVDSPARAPHLITPVRVILVAWALSAVVLFIRLAIGLRKGARIARQATPWDDTRLMQMLARVAGRHAQRLTLCRTEQIESPAIFCWCRRPCILLPIALRCDADPGMVEQVLAHEVAHLDRRDHWWRLVAELAVCFVPWHPAVWSLRSAIYETSEMACDARVLCDDQRPDRYAETLLRLTPCRTIQLPAFHAVRGSHCLTRRIRAILEPGRAHDRSGRRALAMIAITAALITTASALAQQRAIVIVPASDAPREQFAVAALPMELDLGIAALGGKSAGSIRLINIGTDPITVADQKAACGCTAVESVKGRVIAPGATLTVPVTLDAPDTADTERRRKVTFMFHELDDPLVMYVRLRTAIR